MKSLTAAVSFVLLFSASSHASFVENPNRIDSNGFPSFFVSRMDEWFSKNQEARKKLGKEEADYVVIFNSTLKNFGKRFPEGYVRQIDYAYGGPYRFLDLEKRKEVYDAAIRVLKKKAPHFPIKNLPNEIGLGLAPIDADIELLIWQSDLAKSPFVQNKSGQGIVILSLKNSKIEDMTLIEVGQKANKPCPSVSEATQTDRITRRGDVKYAYHVDQFQDLALDPESHAKYEKLWTALNLNPGTVICGQPKQLTYP